MAIRGGIHRGFDADITCGHDAVLGENQAAKPVKNTRGAILLSGVALAVYVFLYLPLIVVVIRSFQKTGGGNLSEAGWGLHWYAQALRNPQTLMTMKNTLRLAGISTVISTLIGTLLGYGLARHEFFGKRVVSRLLMIPIAIPDIVMAVSLLLFFAIVRRFVSWFEPSLLTMIIAHVTFQIPFVAVVVRARLDGFENHIEEAASDLGASRWQRIWHVTIPMLGPGILAGALLAFTLSLDDFVVSFFTSGAGSTTVPIYIYSSVKRGLTGEIHALSSMMIVAAILGTAAITWVQWCSTKKVITPHPMNPSQAQKLEERGPVSQSNP